MSNELLVDVDTLRAQVRDKYRDVALDPHGAHHFHTGRPLAARLGYGPTVVDALPDRAVESFAGVGNPFSLRRLEPDERVVDVIGQTHGADNAEAVLIGYLLGVEALRAGKQALMCLTKDGVHVATKGYSDELSVPGAPAIKDLHAEYVDKGGRFLACPVCLKSRGLAADWVQGAEAKGAPSLFEFTQGGALTFNY